jgi:hypothetical protein
MAVASGAVPGVVYVRTPCAEPAEAVMAASTIAAPAIARFRNVAPVTPTKLPPIDGSQTDLFGSLTAGSSAPG